MATVMSSGTRSPAAAKAAACPPRPVPLPMWTRNSSPVDTAGIPSRSARMAACVPLPDPGGPTRTMRIGSACSRSPRGGRSPDPPPQDLAGGSLGQGVGQPHVAGVLVRSHPFLGPFAELVGGGGRAGLQHHRGPHLLAELRVRDADADHLRDGGVLVEGLFDLARIDVVATADDHLLLAVDDRVVAVVVLPREIAGAEPAVGYC